MPAFSRRAFLASGFAAAVRAQPRHLNVLFIAVDDMRPDLGCYGNKLVRTPNLDKLASRGMTFTRTYCQQAVCSPSRTSLLTGRRPDTTGVYELQTHFRKNIPNVVTLPEHFKNNGYTTTGLGKIYHGGLDDPRSWSIAHWVPGAPAWRTAQNEDRSLKQWQRVLDGGMKIPAGGAPRSQRGPSWASSDVADNELPDGKIADTAALALRELKTSGPFFLATGFLKPHLPFIAPKKYFDMYPPGKIGRVDYAERPKGAPEIAFHASGELRNYQDVPQQGEINEEKTLELIRAYYAALSYTDAQIGKVIDELDRLGLRDNTVIIVWGDHGWHLANHGLWAKHSNFEKATRVPMIVSVPGQKNAGKKTAALTEFVDIYPSLAQICGLPKPEGVEGTSFAPLLDNPNRPWKKAAFSQYPRQAPGVGRVMGYSMRTERYRITEWSVPEKNYREVELYDYQTDPDERVNLAADPKNAGIVAKLSSDLKAGWRGEC